MPINFPSTPTNGQLFIDANTGINYTYNSDYGYWEYLSSNVYSIFEKSANNQIIFNDSETSNGSNGLYFDVAANTLYTNTIIAYSVVETLNVKNERTLLDAYDKANAANLLAFNTGIGANDYATGVGANANLFAIGMGTTLNTFFSTAFTTANNSFNVFLVNDTTTLSGPTPAINLYASNGITLSAYTANNNINIGLTATGITPASYGGSETTIFSYRTDLYGRINSISNVTVTNATAVGIAANTVANSVGANANNFAGLMANSSNIFAAGIGTNANTFAVTVFNNANSVNTIMVSAFAASNASVPAQQALFDKVNNSFSLTFQSIVANGTTITASTANDTLNLVASNGLSFFGTSGTPGVTPDVANLSIAPTGVVPGIYGGPGDAPLLTINDYGQVTSASNLEYANSSASILANTVNTAQNVVLVIPSSANHVFIIINGWRQATPNVPNANVRLNNVLALGAYANSGTHWYLPAGTARAAERVFSANANTGFVTYAGANSRSSLFATNSFEPNAEYGIIEMSRVSDAATQNTWVFSMSTASNNGMKFSHGRVSLRGGQLANINFTGNTRGGSWQAYYW